MSASSYVLVLLSEISDLLPVIVGYRLMPPPGFAHSSLTTVTLPTGIVVTVFARQVGYTLRTGDIRLTVFILLIAFFRLTGASE